VPVVGDPQLPAEVVMVGGDQSSERHAAEVTVLEKVNQLEAKLFDALTLLSCGLYAITRQRVRAILDYVLIKVY